MIHLYVSIVCFSMLLYELYNKLLNNHIGGSGLQAAARTRYSRPRLRPRPGVLDPHPRPSACPPAAESDVVIGTWIPALAPLDFWEGKLRVNIGGDLGVMLRK